MTEAEWLASNDPAAMLAFLLDTHPRSGQPTSMRPSDRKLRLFACACVRLSGLLTNSRAEKAVGVAERFVDGDATNDDMGRAYLFGRESDYTGASIVYETVLVDNALQGVWRIRNTNRVSPAVQACLLRDIVGNPFRPVAFDPAWRTRQVVSLAEAAYEENAGKVCGKCKGTKRVTAYPEAYDDPPMHAIQCPDCHGTGKVATGTLDPFRLGLVADALEEAGCFGEKWFTHPLNAHLRSDGPHYRGMWSLDVALGKS